MDPNEILKTGVEILKHTPVLATTAGEIFAAFKFTDLIKAMLGPASNEVAERIHDKVRLYRFGNQLRAVKKAEHMAKDAGFTPKAVPIKLLFPLLEGASMEDDEELHTMWSALLANASDPRTPNSVRPCLIESLKHLSVNEARVLNALYDNAISNLAEYSHVDWSIPYDFVADLRNAFSSMQSDTAGTKSVSAAPLPEPELLPEHTLCFETFRNEGLIAPSIPKIGAIGFTQKGRLLVRMCKAPTNRSREEFSDVNIVAV